MNFIEAFREAKLHFGQLFFCSITQKFYFIHIGIANTWCDECELIKDFTYEN